MPKIYLISRETPLYFQADEATPSAFSLKSLHVAGASFTLPENELPVRIQRDSLVPKDGDYVPNTDTAAFELPGMTLANHSQTLVLSWAKMRLWFGGQTESSKLEVDHLRLSSELLPDMAMDGDLSLAFDSNGKWLQSESTLKRHEPEISIPFLEDSLALDLTSSPNYFAVKWQEPDINYWLSRLMPDFLDTGAPTKGSMVFRSLYQDGVQEIRLDAELASRRTFSVLGLDVTIPSGVTLSLILQRHNATTLNRLLSILSLETTGAIQVASDFTWARDVAGQAMRELQMDPTGLPKLKPLTLDIAPGDGRASLVLLDTHLHGPGETKFLRSLKVPLPKLSLTQSNGRLALADDNLNSLEEGDMDSLTASDSLWTPNFGFAKEFKFPFLFKENGNGSGGSPSLSQFSQHIEIGKPDLDFGSLPSGQSVLEFELPATVKIGGLDFQTRIPFNFNWETFAMKVEHPQGINLTLLDSGPVEKDYMGLHWRFTGAPDTGNLFTLVTQDYNYQLKLAPGAEIIVAYTKLSSEPIRFRVSDFSVSDQGISLTADVLDDPATLNGINTRFRFAGSRLEIKENQIQDFTLRGSGPLPPDLVGDAMVDVFLQFAQDADGNLDLLAGGAKLQGSKLLDCKATRFQFSVDAIGLAFVNDGGFHIYFTLTGQAQFVPAAGDDKEGPLALLPGVKIELVECPLTGDASVLAKHIKLLIEFPKPLTFRFLGAYEMELRAIGFIPSFDPFDGDAAMQITGQVKFAKGEGDQHNTEPDYHSLYIGLPAKGSFIPRLYFEELPLEIHLGTAVKLSGILDFVDDKTLTGFQGEGKLEIEGLPPLAAAFAFMRARHNETSPWQRTWFIYLEASQISLEIPKIKQYIREIGLGFGYRYTLVSIKVADEADDIADLLYRLRELSRTQGDLAKLDRWAIDLEEPGEDPRWTIVLRAMLSQMSANKSPLVYDAAKEKNLANVYLLDVIAALRSDLTFFMAVRGWITANYNDYIEDVQGLRNRPIVSGFVLYAARRKRFLAHVASNPGGYIGDRPALPPQLKKALENSMFSATLLVEPGLMHFEMGWPNMLRWSDAYGPLTVEMSGGFIFRITRTELVVGVSFLARGRLFIEREVSLKIVGVTVTATANVNFGGRFIGVTGLGDSTTPTLIYAGLGLEIRCRLSIKAWIRINLLLFSINEEWEFSLEIGFTARVELGLIGKDVGVRGQGTVSLSVMGFSIQVDVKVAFQEDYVEDAYQRTLPYLHLGLEATEVDRLPAVEPEPEQIPAVSGEMPASFGLDAADDSPARFKAPHYNAYVLRAASDTNQDPPDKEDWSYFVLFPQGEREQASGSPQPETGFLPVPPVASVAESVTEDFRLENIPKADDNSFTLWHFDPLANDGSGSWREITTEIAAGAYGWRVNWDATLFSGVPSRDPTGDPSQDPQTKKVSLCDYITRAFITTLDSEKSVPVRDPDPIGQSQEVLVDERVQNPSDNDFEAAVRGAVEQFRGSPFFKPDPDFAYDRVLDEAFSPETTIYTPDGSIPEEGSAAHEEMQENHQAHQLRGMIIQRLIADLQAYARDPEGFTKTGSSIPFQMGLVFRYTGTPPAWLTNYMAMDGDQAPKMDSDQAPKMDSAQAPKITQRLGSNSTEPDAENKRSVRTFNPVDADFSTNPPLFQNVRHYADANTIAITWDLAWSRSLESVPAGSAQADPEHHLMHYQVRRRALDGQEQEVVYTIKNAQVLRRSNGGGGDLLQRLQPRFQIVDHFGHDTMEQVAALPASGRSYLYTITPKDFSEKQGRPLSLVATRYPNDPPPVPVDGQLTVQYDATTLDLTPADPATPRLVMPKSIRVKWSEPVKQYGPTIGVREYRLVFRREKTLPIGSYGLDSATQRSRHESLPTSNARPLPTDIKLPISPDKEGDGPRQQRSADLPLADLQAAGIFPPGEQPQWRPESWQVFFQTVSTNDVPSALAPVNIVLQILDGSDEPSKRRPAGLEWLPYPTQLPMLSPEDQRALQGVTHVPMPSSYTFTFDGTATDLPFASFKEHPADLRLIRFRWNLGPSQPPADQAYPLGLVAGYHLLELDVDAHTTTTFNEPELLADAVRPVQEIQMLPADDLAFTPNDTLTTSQWEAWYPSQVKRRMKAAETPVKGDALGLGSWYSWRDSLLVWPEWTGLTDGDGIRTSPLHPALQAVIEALDANGFIPDVQISPPLKPGGWKAFVKATAAKTDPYGWGVLQRFGLCVALSLRYDTTAQPVLGQEFLEAVSSAIEEVSVQDGWPEILKKHLFVELLFQPAESIAPGSGGVVADSLLATVQLSLRPAIQQVYKYHKYLLSGTANTKVELALTLSAPALMIHQTDPHSAPVQLETGTTTQTITIPPTGKATVLVRLPLEAAITDAKVDVKDGPEVVLEGKEFDPTDPLATYFDLPVTLAADFSDAPPPAGSLISQPSGNEYNIQWRRFKRYIEALNSTDRGVPADQKIEIPTTALTTTPILADYLAWSRRFFDHSGGLTADKARPAWVATAYPAAGSPAYASPDHSGRLKYDYVLPDEWAHTYRYYIRPYGRYDKLWRSVAQTVDPQAAVETGLPQLDLDAGGLDVVLARKRAVSMPVVLGSSRLDPLTGSSTPVSPGQTWEVIVAQHPEQALIERNRTLARQLAFRQVAFTLLRRFAYPEYLGLLKGYLEKEGHVLPKLARVKNEYHPVPRTYPNLDHLPAGDTLTEAMVRTLDLPERIGVFQQGALVLQWESLPFYYEHRLLLIAQTDSTVSPVNEVSHKEFEYITPTPSAQAAGAVDTVEIRIPLKRFWDSLPPAAKKRWPGEEPPAVDGGPTTYAALPDRDVVYQLIELYSSNVEVQAALLFEETETKKGEYIRRQIGQRFETELTGVAPPTNGVYALQVRVRPVTEIDLEESQVVPDEVVEPDNISVTEDKKLRIIGVLTPTAWETIRAAIGDDSSLYRALDDLYESWNRREPVSRESAEIVSDLLVEPSVCRLVWDGGMAEEDEAALRLPQVRADAGFNQALDKLIRAAGAPVVVSISDGKDPTTPLPDGLKILRPFADRRELTWTGDLTGDDREALLTLMEDEAGDAAFKSGLERLLTRLDERVLVADAPRGLDQGPKLLANKITFDGDANHHTGLTWQGSMTDTEEIALRRWAQIPDFMQATNTLIDTLNAKQVERDLEPLPERPDLADLPGALAAQLTVTDTQLTWRGRLKQAGHPDQLEEWAEKADEPFRDGMAAIAAHLRALRDTPQTVLLSGPLPKGLFPDPPSTKLTLEPPDSPMYTRLAWTGAMSDEEEQGLRAWAAHVPPFLLVAVHALINKLNTAGNQTVEMDPPPRRPAQAELDADELLKGQIRIEAEKVTWTGRLRSTKQTDRLRNLPMAGDPSFQQAVAQILAEIEGQREVLAFAEKIPLRPMTADLPERLQPRLLIGRDLMHCHGIMAEADARGYYDQAQPVDQKAIARLYRQTVRRGLRDSGLKIAARRGTADASDMRTIEIGPLERSQE